MKYNLIQEVIPSLNVCISSDISSYWYKWFLELTVYLGMYHLGLNHTGLSMKSSAWMARIPKLLSERNDCQGVFFMWC